MPENNEQTPLQEGRYFCSRVDGLEYPQNRVFVSENQVHCKHILGPECTHREYPLDKCTVWKEAFENYEHHHND